MSAPRRPRLRAVLCAFVSFAAWALQPEAAQGAYCDLIPGISAANTTYGVFALSGTDNLNDRRWTVSQNYWVAVGAIADNPNDDFDVGVYANTYNPSSPPCFIPLLATSSRPAGQTDFVVGDFNHNPFAEYVNTVTCYSGQCDGQVRGRQVWRDGDIFYADAAPQVLTLPLFADRVVKIWDIYLLQGTTYHFRFQPTGDTQPKLLLFRNPTGGVHWTGRYGAEFESANCVTNYTAPSTGWYGMVVVNDRFSTNPVSITLAVTTGLACACPGFLADGVPESIAPGATQFDAGVDDPFIQFWAIGVRSTSDWDLYGGDSAPGPDAGCISTYQGSSVLSPPKADVLLADRFLAYPPPDTFAVRALRYSGSDGATLEATTGLVLDSNAPSLVKYINADGVVDTWLAYLDADTTYSIRFFPSGDIKLLLFEHLTESLSWQSRAFAALETSTSTTYTAPRFGVYAFVLVKDDGGIDNYDFGFGFCNSPRPLTSKVPLGNYDPVYPAEYKPYFSFNQKGAHWAAACVYGAGGLDWDIAQYAQPSGSAWPVCLGASGALSNGVVGADVIAGDFHYVPTGAYYLHSYLAGVNLSPAGYTEWDAGSGPLPINPPQPTHVNMAGGASSDRLWCFEAYLNAGLSYTLTFAHSGIASPRALVFENPGTAPYWAPRSAAILSVNSTTAFIPSTTGWHGIVVVNDNEGSGSFDLSITSPVVSAESPAAPTHDELTAVAPNPAHGPLRIDYALSHPAAVDWEVVDLAGRRVARISGVATAAGRWSQPWDGLDGDGHALSGGVYWLRMNVDGRTVATRKILRLN